MWVSETVLSWLGIIAAVLPILLACVIRQVTIRATRQSANHCYDQLLQLLPHRYKGNGTIGDKYRCLETTIKQLLLDRDQAAQKIAELRGQISEYKCGTELNHLTAKLHKFHQAFISYHKLLLPLLEQSKQ